MFASDGNVSGRKHSFEKQYCGPAGVTDDGCDVDLWNLEKCSSSERTGARPVYRVPYWICMTFLHCEFSNVPGAILDLYDCETWKSGGGREAGVPGAILDYNRRRLLSQILDDPASANRCKHCCNQLNLSALAFTILHWTQFQCTKPCIALLLLMQR